MAEESNEIITKIRIIGAGEYSRAAHYAATSVREIDSAQTRAERSGRRLGEKMDALSQKAGRGMAKAATVGLTFGAGLVKMGINFDAMIQRSEIGIGSLIGDMDKAKDITADVRKFALEAPLFGTDQMIKTAQQLIGAGYDAKNVVPYLTTFSDTLSALGRKPEDLQRMTYAFVQMMSKGQISAEELRGQLGEIFPAQKILAREMGLSTQEFAKRMKEGTFKGSKYIKLLLRGMEKDFGGSTQKMATTFDGQLANIRESTKYTLGILFKPLFDYLNKDMFPVLGYFGDEVVKTMTDASLTSDQKFKKIKESADFWLMPIWDDFKNEMAKVDWANVVSQTADKLAPFLGNAFSMLGKGAGKALWGGFKQSDMWGKSLIAALVISKMGLWGPIFGGLGKALGKKFGKQVAAEAAAKAASGQALGQLEASGSKAGGRWGKAFAVGAAAFLLYEFYDKGPEWSAKIAEFLGVDKKKTRKHWVDTKNPKTGKTEKGLINPKFYIDIPRNVWETLTLPLHPQRHRKWDKGKVVHRQHGGPTLAGNPYMVGESGPELFVPGMGGNIRPSLGGMTLHNYLVIDGRVAAQTVAKHNFSEMARR
jgi:tape measure domain-containing protein